MSNEVKVQLKQKTADGNNDLMPKTIADNVFVDETTTLSTKLTAMDESISNLVLLMKLRLQFWICLMVWLAVMTQ